MKPKLKIVITNMENGDELFCGISDDVEFTFKNDLVPVIGNITSKTAPLFSQGWFIELSGYFPNPNTTIDYKKALEEMDKDL